LFSKSAALAAYVAAAPSIPTSARTAALSDSAFTAPLSTSTVGWSQTLASSSSPLIGVAAISFVCFSFSALPRDDTHTQTKNCCSRGQTGLKLRATPVVVVAALH